MNTIMYGCGLKVIGMNLKLFEAGSTFFIGMTCIGWKHYDFRSETGLTVGKDGMK